MKSFFLNTNDILITYPKFKKNFNSLINNNNNHNFAIFHTQTKTEGKKRKENENITSCSLTLEYTLGIITTNNPIGI